jgi:signal transduction histidine kinase
MRRLVESLLELARLDAGEPTMKRTRFDLAQAANDCIELLQPLAAERRITIEAAVEPAHCLGDPEQLSQVITNVLTNAIHYNYEGGRVRVESKQQNGSAIITITDQGQGIAAEDLPHIFERFWRGDKSRSRANGRTGLGLAISKSIIDAHNGSVDVVSELGKGTTFTIRLPETA